MSEHSIRPDGQPSEEIIDPGRPIVDCHHHLWARPGARYLADEFIRDASAGHRVEMSVFIQCRTGYDHPGGGPLAPARETAYVASLTQPFQGAASPVQVAAGIIGYADMTRGGAVAALLDEHLAQGGGRFKGVRHIVSWDADPVFHVDGYPTAPGMLGLAPVRAAFKELEKRDLCFEAMVFHHQLGELAALAARHDGARIVVNHIGLPLGIGAYARERAAVFATWRSGIEAAAACPNLFLKLGGMGMPMLGLGLDQRPGPVTSVQMAEAYAPFVEICVEAFGAERCMFESNFPVDRVSGGYRTLWNAFKRIAAPYSESERTALFSASARRFYRLAASPSSCNPPPQETR